MNNYQHMDCWILPCPLSHDRYLKEVKLPFALREIPTLLLAGGQQEEKSAGMRQLISTQGLVTPGFHVMLVQSSSVHMSLTHFFSAIRHENKPPLRQQSDQKCRLQAVLCALALSCSGIIPSASHTRFAPSLQALPVL